MSWAGVRVGVGTRVAYDGEDYEVAEFVVTTVGTDVVLGGPAGVRRVSLVALLCGDRTRLLSDGRAPGTAS
jgi:hypothetical protein